MSCGCNLQTGGRRKKRSRHSRRKFRGGLFGFGSDNSSNQSAFDINADNIQTGLRELPGKIRETTESGINYVSDKGNDLANQGNQAITEFKNSPDVQEGKKIVSRVADETGIAVKSLYDGARQAPIAIQESALGVKSELGSIFSTIIDKIKSVGSKESPSDASQSGGRRYRHKHKSRKMHRGGKSKKRSKRRTRKH